jgi:hypothetical protein
MSLTSPPTLNFVPEPDTVKGMIVWVVGMCENAVEGKVLPKYHLKLAI